MSGELYSITSDFGGEAPNTSKLRDEIIASNIVSDLISIDRSGDSIIIRFQNNLSGGDKTTLDSIVAAHTVEQPVSETVSVILASATPRGDAFDNTTNRRCATMEYAGTNNALPIKLFSCVAYMDSGITNYTISVYDLKNKLYLASGTFTNTEEDVVQLGTISNLPQKSTTLEVQVKRTGGPAKKYVYIDKITAWG